MLLLVLDSGNDEPVILLYPPHMDPPDLGGVATLDYPPHMDPEE